MVIDDIMNVSRKDIKKKYTVNTVKKMVDKLYGGKLAHNLETPELKKIYNKIEDEIYPYSDNDAKTYLSDYVLLEIDWILKKRDEW
jgi:hypothetical protein